MNGCASALLGAVPGLLPVIVILPRKFGPCSATTTSSGRVRSASPTCRHNIWSTHLPCCMFRVNPGRKHLPSHHLGRVSVVRKLARLWMTLELRKLLFAALKALANSSASLTQTLCGAQLMIHKQQAANSSVLKRRANFSTFQSRTAYFTTAEIGLMTS